MYTHIYIYIYIYTHTHISTCAHRSPFRDPEAAKGASFTNVRLALSGQRVRFALAPFCSHPPVGVGMLATHLSESGTRGCQRRSRQVCPVSVSV